MTPILRGFPGFVAGKTRFTTLPNDFFSDLLPLVDNLDELKAILYVFWQLGQGEGDVRYLRLDDALADLLFLDGLLGEPETRAQAARQAFTRAAQRGALLEVTAKIGERAETWYFLNSQKGREAVERLRRGEFTGLLHDIDDVVIGLEKERPNIFLLYEQNIGVITPLLADRLRQAERDYPENWIRDAFSIAVAQNKRSWAYISRILQNWAEHGKDTPSQAGRSLAPSSNEPSAGDNEFHFTFVE